MTGSDDVEGSDDARPQFIIDDKPKRNLVRFPHVSVDMDQPGERLQCQPRFRMPIKQMLVEDLSHVSTRTGSIRPASLFHL